VTKDEIKHQIWQAQIETAVGQKLAQAYTGYQWQIDCSIIGGVVTIKNLNLSGDYGFVLHLRDLEHDTDLKSVILAGGELLERCNLPRTFRPEDYTELVETDLRDNVIGDTHGAS
jgi:hypothetical protein